SHSINHETNISSYKIELVISRVGTCLPLSQDTWMKRSDANGLFATSCINTTVGEAQCNGDLQGLITECSEYVQNPGPIKNPSQACCNVLKNVDVKCMCNHITKQAEQMISMPKAMHCLQSCGKSLAHGSKCGSYTVP
ncbi:Protein MEN-8, partial [Bienertia sinuspersici]